MANNAGLIAALVVGFLLLRGKGGPLDERFLITEGTDDAFSLEQSFISADAEAVDPVSTPDEDIGVAPVGNLAQRAVPVSVAVATVTPVRTPTTLVNPDLIDLGEGNFVTLAGLEELLAKPFVQPDPQIASSPFINQDLPTIFTGPIISTSPVATVPERDVFDAYDDWYEDTFGGEPISKTSGFVGADAFQDVEIAAGTDQAFSLEQSFTGSFNATVIEEEFEGVY